MHVLYGFVFLVLRLLSIKFMSPILYYIGTSMMNINKHHMDDWISPCLVMLVRSACLLIPPIMFTIECGIVNETKKT